MEDDNFDQQAANFSIKPEICMCQMTHRTILSCVRLQNNASMAREMQPWQNTETPLLTCESLMKRPNLFCLTSRYNLFACIESVRVASSCCSSETENVKILLIYKWWLHHFNMGLDARKSLYCMQTTMTQTSLPISGFPQKFRNTIPWFVHDFTFQQCNFHDYFMHDLQPPLLAASSPLWA